MNRPSPETRDRYPYFLAIATRWMGNDVYGLVNNVVYYSYFDSVVNHCLIERGALDIASGPVIGLVVDPACQYFSPIVFPNMVHEGLRVGKLGRSSIRYELGVFRNDERQTSAQGHFVHVCVDRASSRAVPIPSDLRAVLQPPLSASHES